MSEKKHERTTRGFLLCWLKNIFSSTYRYQLQCELREHNRTLEYTISISILSLVTGLK